LNNNKLVNEKLICSFRWSVLSSIMKMHGPKNKIHKSTYMTLFIIRSQICLCFAPSATQ